MSRRSTRQIASSFALAGLLALTACRGGEPTTATTSGATLPEPTTPDATSPDATSPGVSSPGVSSPGISSPGTASPSAVEPTAPGQTPVPEPTAGGDSGEAAVADTGVEAAQIWIEALGSGDRDTAFAVLGEASRQQAGGREGLESMASALAEGWGAFAFADPSYLPTSLATSGEGEAGVVTVLATVSQEGMTERRALPLPYRIDASGRATVDPFVLSDAPASIEQPASGTTVACDVVLTASVPAGAPAVSLGVDGQISLEPEIIPTDSEVDAATGELSDGFSAGEHVLTAAFVDGGGRIGAVTSIFTVEQGCA